MYQPKVLAFFDLIARSEGTSTHPLTKDDGYDIIVSGVDGLHSFTSYAAHPFADGRPPVLVSHGPPVLESTASGRYQQRLRNWQVYRIQLNLPDFGHESQDKMAFQEMNECHAVPFILADNVAAAVHACRSRWASFPGGTSGQPAHSMEQLLAWYADLLEKRQ